MDAPAEPAPSAPQPEQTKEVEMTDAGAGPAEGAGPVEGQAPAEAGHPPQQHDQPTDASAPVPDQGSGPGTPTTPALGSEKPSKVRTARVSMHNLPPPREPSQRRTNYTNALLSQFPPLELPDWSDGVETEPPKTTGGAEYVKLGPESPIYQRWLRLVSENLRNRDGTPKTITQLRQQLASMSRETRRGGGGAGSARQSMADAAAFEKYEPQPTTSLRGAGRTSRNSGGLGLYSSPIAAPAAGTGTNAVSVNLGQIPSLPEFPAGYTLYMYRRPKWTQPKGPRKFAAAAKEAAHGGVNIGGVIVSGGDEGDENRTETESVDGEGAESLDGSVDDRKESAAGSASGAASGGPPPGAKISGWRSDTIMFGHPSGRKFKSANEFLVHAMFLYVTDYDMKLAKGETPRETTGPLPVFDDEGDGMDENAMRPETPATPQPHGGSDPQRPSAQGTPQHQELSTPTKAPVAANLPDYKQCPCPACTPWVNQLEKEKIQAMKQSSGGGAVKGDETEDEETGATSGKRKRTKKVKEEDEDMGDSQSKLARRIKFSVLKRMGLMPPDEE